MSRRKELAKSRSDYADETMVPDEIRFMERAIDEITPESESDLIEESKTKLTDDMPDETIKNIICPYFWFIHFDRSPQDTECGDCQDLHIGACPGGREPVECLRENKPAKGTTVGFFVFDDGSEKEIRCKDDCKECKHSFSTLIYHTRGFAGWYHGCYSCIHETARGTHGYHEHPF